MIAEADGTPRIASPFGQRDVHPALAAILEYVERGFDADLGLVRMGLRDYDPEIIRFTTPDPLFLERPEGLVERPIAGNLYGYARANPLSFRDPTGTSDRPADDPRFERAMFFADPVMYSVIVGSNNLSPWKLERAFVAGDWDAQRVTALNNTLVGLEGEAVYIKRTMEHGFPAIAAGPVPKDLLGNFLGDNVPDVFVTGLASRLDQVVVHGSGAIGSITFRLSFVGALAEVKTRESINVSADETNGIDQTKANLGIIRAVPLLNPFALLVVDLGAWLALTPEQQQLFYGKLPDGAYITPLPGLVQQAERDLQTYLQDVRNRYNNDQAYDAYDGSSD